jgi:crotonobetainyl-CoA:carnitine CoA-transferase CaiB-like acyl-CoA transferase
MGEHTEEVLAEILGLSAAQIAELRVAGAFGTG